MNNDIPTMLSYTDFHLDLYKRLYLYRNYNKAQLITCSENIVQTRYPSDIRINLGCMTPCERNQLITFIEKNILA